MIRPALSLLILFTVVTGAAYPAAITGLAQLAFPSQANGSLVVRDGKAVGSALIGQATDDPRSFLGRPAAGKYDAAASTGSNLGPLNPALREAVEARVQALRALDPGNTAPVPLELVTTSGSGLDPHLSPEGAAYQVPRVARLRGLSPTQVQTLVDQHTEGRTFGVLGEPRVNVLELNLALDGVQGSSGHERAPTPP